MASAERVPVCWSTKTAGESETRRFEEQVAAVQQAVDEDHLGQAAVIMLDRATLGLRIELCSALLVAGHVDSPAA